MKRFFRIFELTKNEQRVVLIVVFVLISVALISYERRTHRTSFQTTSAVEPKSSPSPVETEEEQ